MAVVMSNMTNPIIIEALHSMDEAIKLTLTRLRILLKDDESDRSYSDSCFLWTNH